MFLDELSEQLFQTKPFIACSVIPEINLDFDVCHPRTEKLKL